MMGEVEITLWRLNGGYLASVKFQDRRETEYYAFEELDNMLEVIKEWLLKPVGAKIQ